MHTEPFHQIGETDSPRVAIWAACFCCLATAGLVALRAVPVATKPGAGFSQAIAWSAGYAGLVLAATLAVGFLLLSSLRLKWALPIRALLVWFACVAVWFAPAAVFATKGMLWAMAAFALLAMALGKLLPIFDETLAGGTAKTSISPWSTSLTLKVVTGTAYISAICYFLGQFTNAIFLASISCFVISLIGFTSSELTHPLKARPATSIPLAILIAAIGLLPNLRWVPKPIPVHLQNHTGVILLSDLKPPVTIAVPKRSFPIANSFSGKEKPISIPFSGEYWFFDWPSRRPPKSALIRKGNPATSTFTSVSREPFLMQAHQTIPEPISVTRCRRIDLVLASREKQPETVKIQLLIRNSESKNISQSLTAETTSITTSLPAKEGDVSRVTLKFFIPPQSRVQSFDQIQVSFHLSAPRSKRSASFAIERFDLIQ